MTSDIKQVELVELAGVDTMIAGRPAGKFPSIKKTVKVVKRGRR